MSPLFHCAANLVILVPVRKLSKSFKSHLRTIRPSKFGIMASNSSSVIFVASTCSTWKPALFRISVATASIGSEHRILEEKARIAVACMLAARRAASPARALEATAAIFIQISSHNNQSGCTQRRGETNKLLQFPCVGKLSTNTSRRSGGGS